MNAGDLKCRVSILEPVLGQDAAGQPLTGFAFKIKLWAAVVYLTGRQTVLAGALTSVAKATITIRKRSDITAAMRVQFGTTIFAVKAVLPNEATRDRIDLVAEVSE